MLPTQKFIFKLLVHCIFLVIIHPNYNPERLENVLPLSHYFTQTFSHFSLKKYHFASAGT